jgi:hypothetical protein
VSRFGEAPVLAVLETQALPGEAALQNAILLAQERDHVGLLAMKPATQGSISNWNGSTVGVYVMAVDLLVGPSGSARRAYGDDGGSARGWRRDQRAGVE